MKYVNLPAILFIGVLWAFANSVKMIRHYWNEHETDEVTKPFWKWRNWPEYWRELKYSMRPQRPV